MTLLTDCGGGGGGTTPPPPPQPPDKPQDRDGSWLTFSPSPAQASAYEGESTEIVITANATRAFTKPMNIAIIDDKGIISPNVAVSASGAMQYQARLGTSPALKAGTHLTTLQVRVCEDSPTVCQLPFPGSPWTLPLGVNVKLRGETDPRVALTATPTQPVADAGAATTFTIDGTIAADLVGRANFALVDKEGFLESPLSLQMTTPATLRASLRTKPVQTPGVYPHTVELKACHDALDVCKNPVAGSPFLVAVTLKVNPTANTSPLKPLAGLTPWSTKGGNAAHSGFVAASFDPAKFNRRWSLGTSPYRSDSSLAIENGKVFSVRKLYDTVELIAVDEASGNVSWRTSLAATRSSSAAAVGNGRVFVITDGKLKVVNQTTGSIESEPDAYISSLPGAPVLYDNRLFVMDGRGLTAFSGANYTRAWGLSTPDYPWWNVSVNDSGFYLFADGVLHAGRADTGEQLFSITAPELTSKSGVTPVLGDNQMAFVKDGNNLAAFKLASRSVAWLRTGTGLGQPAYANGVVYTVGSGNSSLQAHAADTGALLWQSEYFLPLRSDSYLSVPQLVVTNNLAFVSTAGGTYAVDLATRRVVWGVPEAGDLSISQNGILYILTDSGAISAFNLQ